MDVIRLVEAIVQVSKDIPLAHDDVNIGNVPVNLI
jgi:hypothetical protein